MTHSTDSKLQLRLRNEIWVINGMLDHNLSYEALQKVSERYTRLQLPPLSHYFHSEFYEAPLEQAPDKNELL